MAKNYGIMRHDHTEDIPLFMKYYSSLFITLLFFNACTTIEPIKPTSSTKTIMTLDDAIKAKRSVLADDLYLKFRGDHPESKKLPTYLLKLSQVHMDVGEYLLAKYYADSYMTEYPAGRRMAQAAFLRVKSLFLRFEHNQTDPLLQKQLKEDIKVFLKHFSKSKDIKKVKEFQKEFQKMYLKKNIEIAETYERMGKYKAAKYYRNKD